MAERRLFPVADGAELAPLPVLGHLRLLPPGQGLRPADPGLGRAGAAPPEAAHGWIGAAAGCWPPTPRSARRPGACSDLRPRRRRRLSGCWPLLERAGGGRRGRAAAAPVRARRGRPAGRHGGDGAVTSLPWFASYLMPDLYAGLLILAAATLAFAWRASAAPSARGLSALYLLVDHLPHLAPAAGGGLAGWRRCCRPRLAGGSRGRCGWACRSPAAVVLLLGASWLGFGHASLSPQGAAVPPRPVLGGRPGAGLPRGRLPGGRLGDLRRARCAGGHGAGLPVAPERSYWSMESGRAGGRPRRGDGDPRPGDRRRSRWASCALRSPTRPSSSAVRAGRPRPGPRCGGDRRGLHLRLPAGGTRRGLGPRSCSAP